MMNYSSDGKKGALGLKEEASGVQGIFYLSGVAAPGPKGFACDGPLIREICYKKHLTGMRSLPSNSVCVTLFLKAPLPEAYLP